MPLDCWNAVAVCRERRLWESCKRELRETLAQQLMLQFIRSFVQRTIEGIHEEIKEEQLRPMKLSWQILTDAVSMSSRCSMR